MHLYSSFIIISKEVVVALLHEENKIWFVKLNVVNVLVTRHFRSWSWTFQLNGESGVWLPSFDENHDIADESFPKFVKSQKILPFYRFKYKKRRKYGTWLITWYLGKSVRKNCILTVFHKSCRECIFNFNQSIL